MSDESESKRLKTNDGDGEAADSTDSNKEGLDEGGDEGGDEPGAGFMDLGRRYVCSL